MKGFMQTNLHVTSCIGYVKHMQIHRYFTVVWLEVTLLSVLLGRV